MGEVQVFVRAPQGACSPRAAMGLARCGMGQSLRTGERVPPLSDAADRRK